MANYATKFYSASYVGGYTSSVVKGNSNDNSNQPRGVIQVDITTGTVDLQMRLTDEAPWFTIKSYTADTVEEVVLAPQMRVVASADAEVWLAETH
jgi:archaeosine-15-forming tRNA-guanine transglycosylase